jgi:hypothetical protein
MVAFGSFNPFPLPSLLYKKKKIIIDANDSSNHHHKEHFLFNSKWMG